MSRDEGAEYSAAADGRGDDSLVQRAVAGDAEAFGDLYTRHMEPIYRYIYFRAGDALEAEDLTEEVFIRAWEALPRYKQGGIPFKSWLYRIAHNLVIDFHRKRKSAEVPDLELLSLADNLAHASEESMAHDEAVSLLAQAILTLGEEEQQVLILRFVEGLSHKETAAIIGKSEGACRVIQHRALAALNERLGRPINKAS